MLKIKHILFPIDFSERCCGAVPFVESVAKRYSAKVTLLSVVQPAYYSAIGDMGGAVVFDNEEVRLAYKDRLDSSLTRDFAGLRVDRTAELGDPARTITDFAHTHAVDLIMMPTHGYGPYRGLLLGSVAAKVLHDAECQVWTATHMVDPPRRDHLDCRKVVCAVDGTPNSVSLIKWASDFSGDCGATLRLVHVIPGMEGGQTRQLDREFEADMRTEARETIERIEELAGLKPPICIAAGDVAERVREEARDHDADLVVIGRGVLQGTLGRLRTHAYGIIRRSPCPVLSV